MIVLLYNRKGKNDDEKSESSLRIIHNFKRGTMENIENIKKQLKTLPEKPGVYIMKDKYGNVIYIGKSKKLKDRVTSYFRGFNSHTPKTQTMVTNIHEFDYIITDTEMEALILEANLIKKYMPRFNIMLKDDKHYPFIRITVKEKYPRVFMTRTVVKDGSRYFGPYTSAEAVKQTLTVIHKVFPVRKCNKNLALKGQRHCLNYHIGKCLGPCASEVSAEIYDALIQEIIRFLSGDSDALIKDLNKKMLLAAEALEFEKAAEYRNQINSIKELNTRQKMMTGKDIDQDIVALACDEDYACFMTFFIRGGKLLGRDERIIENIEGLNQQALLSAFIKQHYMTAEFLPKEIIIQSVYDDYSLIEGYLSKKKGVKVKFIIPKKGEKLKLLRMAEANAFEYLSKFKERIDKEVYERKAIQSALEEIVGEDIYRIESFDISNISGVFTVASMVVYENYKKKKTDYRRFKIKTIIGQNDYGAMEEVITRRFRHGLEDIEKIKATGLTGKEKFAVFPDLLLMDGGKGQVNVAKSVLKTLGLNIPIAGMVKNEYHITEKLYYEGQMYDIKSNQLLYAFLGKVQEEVHRFAIDYHKSLRKAGMVYSVLEDISGVGKKRRISLIKEFKSIERIKGATVEELSAVEGVSLKVAENIYRFFNESQQINENEV